MWSGHSLDISRYLFLKSPSKYRIGLVIFKRFSWFKYCNSSAILPAWYCLSSHNVERSINVTSSYSGIIKFLISKELSFPSFCFIDMIPSFGSLYKVSSYSSELMSAIIYSLSVVVCCKSFLFFWLKLLY